MRLGVILCVLMLTMLAMPVVADEVDDYILQLKYGVNSARWQSAEALGKIGDSRAVDPLIEALTDESIDVRYKSAEALGKIGDSRAVDPLIVALSDTHPSVRQFAAWSLGAIGDRRALDPLLHAYENGDKYVRVQAAGSLVKLGYPEYFNVIITALRSGDSSDREFAAKALGNTGDSRAVDPLTYVANNDEVGFVRNAASEALARLSASISTMVSGQIDSVGWPDVRNYGYGEAIPVVVNLSNTGTQAYSFWVGYSVQDNSGDWWDAAPQQTSVIQPGDGASVTLQWQPPNIAPEGAYASVVALWEGYNSDTGLMEGELDRETKTDAFWLVAESGVEDTSDASSKAPTDDSPEEETRWIEEAEFLTIGELNEILLTNPASIVDEKVTTEGFVYASTHEAAKDVFIVSKLLKEALGEKGKYLDPLYVWNYVYGLDSIIVVSISESDQDYGGLPSIQAYGGNEAAWPDVGSVVRITGSVEERSVLGKEIGRIFKVDEFLVDKSYSTYEDVMRSDMGSEVKMMAVINESLMLSDNTYPYIASPTFDLYLVIPEMDLPDVSLMEIEGTVTNLESEEGRTVCSITVDKADIVLGI